MSGANIEGQFRNQLIEYVQTQPLEELREMCRAAEEWYDGTNSKMREFGRSNGLLETGEDYHKMAFEAFEAIAELKGEKSEVWRQSLLKLNSFGMRMYYIDQKLRQVAVLVAELALAGVGGHHVKGVISYALRDGNAARAA